MLVKVLPGASAVPLIKWVSLLAFCLAIHSVLIFHRGRILNGQYTHPSVLGLNALLAESSATLMENFPDETVSTICQGIAHKDVSSYLRCVILTCC